jgi:hypothetical protein
MGQLAWLLLAVLLILSALGGWAVAEAIKRQWRQEPTDQRQLLISPGVWGEPDLAPPSVLPVAQVEVARLEALWALPPHRASSEAD